MGLAGWGEDIRTNAAADTTATSNAAMNSAPSIIWDQFVAQPRTVPGAGTPVVQDAVDANTLLRGISSNAPANDTASCICSLDGEPSAEDYLDTDDNAVNEAFNRGVVDSVTVFDDAVIPAAAIDDIAIPMAAADGTADTGTVTGDAAPEAVTGDAPTPTLKATADAAPTPAPEQFMPAPVSSKAVNDEVMRAIRDLRLWPSPEDKNTCDISLIELHEVGFVLKHAARFDDLDYYKLAREAQQVKRQLLEVGAAPDSLSSPNLDKLIEFLEKKYEENN